MKTTLDLPDEILLRAKIAASERQTTLDALVLQGLEYVLSKDSNQFEDERKKKAEKLLQLLSQIKIIEPIGKWNRDEIYNRQQENGK